MTKKYFIIGAVIVAAMALLYTSRDNFSAMSSKAGAVILQVPFTPQAPTDKWDRNEDCEETSITMANAFLSGNTSNELDPSEAIKSIENLKVWENANLGYNKDTGSMATTRMAEGAFAMKVKQIKDFKEQDLKNALANNHPILLPIDARVLDNPLYRNSGPQYHMIVIRGYKEGKFIVNDPGTNRGNGNEYTFDVLHRAAADWNQAQQRMEPESKIALVMSK